MGTFAGATFCTHVPLLQTYDAHYLMMTGAHGGAAWTAKGVQFGDYENAIGTGQVTIWFDGGIA